MKKKPTTSETRKASITTKDGTRYTFDIPKATAEKVLWLQKIILEQRAEKKESQSD